MCAASDQLAVASEKMAMERLVYWMTHEIAVSPASEAHESSALSEGGVSGSSVAAADTASSQTSGGGVAGGKEAKIVTRRELRGRELLKHIRWAEFQREALSEMFVKPDPKIGNLIQSSLIESLAWANFPCDLRHQYISNSDVAHHPKHLLKHTVLPREGTLPMTPLPGYESSLEIRPWRGMDGRLVRAVGENGGVAVFGSSTHSAVKHYILEWSGGESGAAHDDGYMGVMCATSLSLEKSGCFVLCGNGDNQTVTNVHAEEGQEADEQGERGCWWRHGRERW